MLLYIGNRMATKLLADHADGIMLVMWTLQTKIPMLNCYSYNLRH